MPLVAPVHVVVHAKRGDDVVWQGRGIMSAPFVDLERHLAERRSRHVRFSDRGALHYRARREAENSDYDCAGEHFCSMATEGADDPASPGIRRTTR